MKFNHDCPRCGSSTTLGLNERYCVSRCDKEDGPITNPCREARLGSLIGLRVIDTYSRNSYATVVAHIVFGDKSEGLLIDRDDGDNDGSSIADYASNIVDKAGGLDRHAHYYYKMRSGTTFE